MSRRLLLSFPVRMRRALDEWLDDRVAVRDKVQRDWSVSFSLPTVTVHALVELCFDVRFRSQQVRNDYNVTAGESEAGYEQAADFARNRATLVSAWVLLREPYRSNFSWTSSLVLKRSQRHKLGSIRIVSE